MFLKSLETQRQRWNSNWKPNGRETDRNSTDYESRTVRYSTADSPLQYSTVPRTVRRSKNWKRTSWKQFYSRLKNICYSTTDSPGLGGGQSASTDTVQQWKHRKKTQLLDCLLQYRGQSANRETAGTQSSKNRLLSLIFRFAAKSSPTATKLGEHDHKTVGELPLRGHRPI
jgi:hypothetical protein